MKNPKAKIPPTTSRLRRWSTRTLAVLLWILIAGYWYLSDSRRVRAMAESYLSQLVGGRVEVKHARLSIFEGLRLDGVKLYVDPDNTHPDALLFSAATVQINYSVRSMLSGRLAATEIFAIDPQLQLCENQQTGQWNYQRLLPHSAGSSAPKLPPTLILPHIYLRNGLITYRQLQNGALQSGGAMLIDGALSPASDALDAYVFRLQTRTENAQLGPDIVGTFHAGTGTIDASMRGLGFTPDLQAMLPLPVRQWWQTHQLAGQLDIPVFRLEPGPGAPDFFVVAQLSDVRLAIPLAQSGSLNLHGVSGRLSFRPQGIDVQDMRGSVEDSLITATGHIDGYDGAAPLELSLEAPRLVVPAAPPSLPSWPASVRSVFAQLQPHGVCAVHVSVQREKPDQPLRIKAHVALTDAGFTFDKFPYPLRQVSGVIDLATDPANSRNDYCRADLSGLGVVGGANEHTTIAVQAFLSPLDTTDEITIHITADNISSEPALMHALPPDVRQVLTMFDAPGQGALPQLHGHVICDLTRAYGLDKPLKTHVALDLDRLDLTLASFPYPLRNLAGQLVIDDVHTEVHGVHGPCGLSVEGRVDYPPDAPVAPQLTITAHDLPLDADLLNALPPGTRAPIAALGLSGKLDLHGRLLPGDPLGADFAITLHDGIMARPGQPPTLTAIAANMLFDGHRLTIHDLHGQRGSAVLTASGALWLQDQTLRALLDASAENLVADDALCAQLPPAAQEIWHDVRPTGSFNASAHYDTAQPAPLSLTLQPRQLAVNLRILDYPLDDVTGAVKIVGSQIILDQLTAHHGAARVSATGSGTFDGAWDIQAHAQNLGLATDLRHALSPRLGLFLATLHADGKLDLSLSHLSVQPQPHDAPEIHIDAHLNVTDASADPAVQMSDINGSADIQSVLRHGHLDTLQATIVLPSLNIAGWSAQNLQAQVVKDAGQDTVRMDSMQVLVAGGELAGQGTLSLSPASPGNFALALALRDADVRQLGLTGGSPPPFGRLSASLALEGAWGAAGQRRGRGNVTVRDAQMYQLPLVMGLMQITNLALPITSPFRQADASYSVVGQRVTFDHIQLRADNMAMNGGGWLDYATRQVRLSFTTDNPNWPRIPLVSELLEGARHQLLQIHVAGTVQAPQISASTMELFTTTVDEITHGVTPTSNPAP